MLYLCVIMYELIVLIMHNNLVFLFIIKSDDLISVFLQSVLSEKKTPKNYKTLLSNTVHKTFVVKTQNEHIFMDYKDRIEWEIGTEIEIYSRSKNVWFKGKIINIYYDKNGEWLKVKYNKNKIKSIQRLCKDIRPIFNYNKKTDTNNQPPPKQVCFLLNTYI